MDTPEDSTGKNDEGNIGSDVDGTDGVVQNDLESSAFVDCRVQFSLTRFIQRPLMSHGLGNEHWKEIAMIEAKAQATTTPNTIRLDNTVRLSDMRLWRRYEREIFAAAMVRTRKICAAYSYWKASQDTY